MVRLFFLFFLSCVSLTAYPGEDRRYQNPQYRYEKIDNDCDLIADRYYNWFLYSCVRLNLSPNQEFYCIKNIDKDLRDLIDYCNSQYVYEDWFLGGYLWKQ